jgi:glycosyltransferase involved in cell wall biosynthesis
MKLSVIIPVYNSASFILDTFRELVDYLENLGEEYELIFVDDGSRDQTAAIIEKRLAQHPEVRLIRKQKNRGKGFAVKAGMEQARGKFLIFTDADLAYPPTEIGKILEALKDGADLAIATRVASESRFIMSPKFFGYLYTRHVGSRIFNTLVRKLLALSIHDTQAGLKGFRREAKEIIFRRQTLDSFTFDVELIYIAQKFNLQVREVPVVFRYFSEPTTVSFMIQSLASIKDLFSIRAKNKKRIYQ